ncbi:radical SAM protein [bacterium]|nr:radical SAM protein [bacterium]
MFFSASTKLKLLRAALFKDTPIYVQFFVTARCNLTCTSCNVIYANSDVRECTLDEVKRIADNLAEVGVAIVLLTGGEPFARKDLPEIIREFETRGIHVRMQTNGMATEEQIQRAIEFGGHDISISLDSLWPETQNKRNGGFAGSWEKAVQAMANFTKHLPKDGSFASLGCVLQRDNLTHVEDVIRFGTEIGWFTSFVPIHVTDNLHPMSFRSFDQSLRFKPEEYPKVDAVVERIRQMRKEGYLLYDSDQFLDDVKRFVRDEPTTWRSKHGGVCDSPFLYFAILPNGEFAPCVDHRLGTFATVAGPEFKKLYHDPVFRESVRRKTSACPGCMFGSYPEMTITMRFLAAKLQRTKVFFTSPPKKPWPMTYEQMAGIAERIRNERRDRAGVA